MKQIRKLRAGCAVAVLLTLPAFADTLDKVKETGHMTMGVRESSGVLSYTLGDKKYVGYQFDICTKIIAAVAKAVGKPVTTLYQPVTSQNRIPLVMNGTVDIECGSTTNNEARQKDVDFLNTTFIEEIRMVTKANSGIKSAADLKGKTVSVTTGTTSVQTLRRHKGAQGVEFNTIYGKDHADSFLLLESGRSDAFVMDGSLVAGLVARSKNPKDFVIGTEVFSVEPIGIMIRKGDDRLLKIGNDTIAEMIKSKEMYKLYDKWFMSPTPPAATVLNMPMSANLKAAFENPNNKPSEAYLAAGTK